MQYLKGLTKNLAAMTTVTHAKQVDIALSIDQETGQQEQILQVFIIDRPKKRAIVITTKEIRQYEMNLLAKLVRSANVLTVISMA